MEKTLSHYTDSRDSSESDKKCYLSPSLVDIPDTILSPPISRSSSPILDLKLVKNEESDLSDDNDLTFHGEDIKQQEEQTEKDKKARDEAVSEMAGIDQDRRYQQLIHLLEKSSIYTNFLLEKIKSEEQAKKASEERVKKRKSAPMDEESNDMTTVRRGRSNKRKIKSEEQAKNLVKNE